MRLRLRRQVTFRAFHRLAEAGVPDAENRRRFGYTVEPHPHHYRCDVTVSRVLEDPEFVVMDLPALDAILADEVTTPFGGRHLHRDVPAFTTVPPTCEAIARHVFRRVAARLPAGVRLDCVSIAEDDSLSAECLAE